MVELAALTIAQRAVVFVFGLAGVWILTGWRRFGRGLQSLIVQMNAPRPQDRPAFRERMGEDELKLPLYYGMAIIIGVSIAVMGFGAAIFG